LRLYNLEAYRNNYSLWGNGYVASQTNMAHYVWVFYISKMYEFVDTFIMVGRCRLTPG